jgi:hypothetical protein
MLRDFQSFRFQDLTKPLSDLVANCATMDVVERQSLSVALRHAWSQSFSIVRMRFNMTEISEA